MAEPPDDANLEVISVDKTALPAQPDDLDKQEELELASSEADYWRQSTRELEDLRGLRKKYASRVFGFMVAWTAVVAGLLILDGFSLWGFELDTTVLTTIIGGTTISVIGLVLAIIRGLFPRSAGPPSRGSSRGISLSGG